MLLNRIKFLGKIAIVYGIIGLGNSFWIDRAAFLGLSASKVIASELDNPDNQTNLSYTISSEQEIESIKNLLENNIQAYQQEDINGVMKTMHPDSPTNLEVKQLSEYAFAYYDIQYEQNSFEIVSLSDSDAIVRITQTAKTIENSDFKNNRTTSLQTLKKYDGQWKFFGFLGVENVEYLN